MQRSGRGELNEDLAKVWVVRGVLMEVDFGHGEMLGWWMGICSSSNSGEKNENTRAGRQWMGCSPACLLPPIRKSMVCPPGSPRPPAGSGLIASKNKGQKKMKKKVVKNATDQRCEKSLRRDAPPDSNQSPSPLQIPICLA